MCRALLASALLLALLPATSAAAERGDLDDPIDQWLPSSQGASWTYEWRNSEYAPVMTRERYTLAEADGPAFQVNWTTDGLGNGPGSVSSAGAVRFVRTQSGLINAADGWTATPPPPNFPILCSQAAQCPNSLASTFFMLIWGSRSPVLQEPLLRRSRWTSTGGGEGGRQDVASENRYRGVKRVKVPAFPDGIEAAKVESDITQAGAIGDPFGSGIRSVWWVRGVGPVKIKFRHTSGEKSFAHLVSTNLAPIPLPREDNYLPFERGKTMKFRWRNNKHMRKASVQRLTVAQVVNNTARVDVESLKGRIQVAGSYIFTTRLDGITNISTSTAARSLAKFPKMGPRSLPGKRRRKLLTPFDFMTYGFNPVLPVRPGKGDVWRHEKGSRDYDVFGVKGRSKVIGIRHVKTPTGSFRAFVVKSKLKQRGFPYGSGNRVMWFAPNKGLVKLRFKHGDGSVSIVKRIR